MNPRIAISCSMAIALAGCAGAPKITVPDGRTRQPVNSPASIEAYKVNMALDEANYGARAALSRQLQAVKRDIAEIKSILGMGTQEVQARFTSVRAINTKTGGRANSNTPSISRSQPPAAVAGESIEARPRSVTFRLSHAESSSDFRPSTTFSAQLLQAVRQADQVEIRGRTDGSTPSLANQRVAAARANAAKAYLLAHGIEAGKIRTAALPAGGHLADNNTIEGKALNRRVEIEAMDLDTSAFAAVDKHPGGTP